MNVLRRLGLGLALLCLVGTACDRDEGAARSQPPAGAGAAPVSSPAASSVNVSPEATAAGGTKLGVRRLGDVFAFAWRLGPVSAGKETEFEVQVQNGSAKTLRCWVGNQLAKDETKVAAQERSPNTWRVTVKAPDVLPYDCEFYVEAESAGGAKGSASFPLMTQ